MTSAAVSLKLIKEVSLLEEDFFDFFLYDFLWQLKISRFADKVSVGSTNIIYQITWQSINVTSI